MTVAQAERFADRIGDLESLRSMRDLWNLE
jgi:hypothetical protein